MPKPFGVIPQLPALAGTPAGNPPVGAQLLYFKSDGELYRKNSAGIETQVAEDAKSNWLVEVNGVYPPRPLPEPAVFVGPDNPDTMGLMLVGDTWIDNDDDGGGPPLYPLLVDDVLQEQHLPVRLRVAAEDARTAHTNTKLPNLWAPGGQFVTGHYYGCQHGAQGSATPTADLLHAAPFLVAANGGFAIDQIGLNVTTAGLASHVRVGIYEDNGGVPGSLRIEFTATTTLSTTTAGVHTLAVSHTLPTGLYWLAVVSHGTAVAAVSTLTGSHPLIGKLSVASTTGSAMAYTATVPNGLPANYPTPTGMSFMKNVVMRAA